MKRSRFSEEQIIVLLKEHQAGLGEKELCRKHGGIEVSDAKKLKALDAENAKLKKLPVEQMIDVSTLNEMLGKNFFVARFKAPSCGLDHDREAIQSETCLCFGWD